MVSKRIETVLSDLDSEIFGMEVADQFWERAARSAAENATSTPYNEFFSSEIKFAFIKKNLDSHKLNNFMELQNSLLESDRRLVFANDLPALTSEGQNNTSVVRAFEIDEFQRTYLKALNPDFPTRSFIRRSNGNNEQDRLVRQILIERAERIQLARSELLARVLYQDEIVVQNSPPEIKSLTDLIKQSPGVAIGAYAGFEAAVDMPMLLLATVPGGIILGGLSFAVTKALSAGLHQQIDRYFDQ